MAPRSSKRAAASVCPRWPATIKPVKPSAGGLVSDAEMAFLLGGGLVSAAPTPSMWGRLAAEDRVEKLQQKLRGGKGKAEGKKKAMKAGKRKPKGKKKAMKAGKSEPKGKKMPPPPKLETR